MLTERSQPRGVPLSAATWVLMLLALVGWWWLADYAQAPPPHPPAVQRVALLRPPEPPPRRPEPPPEVAPPRAEPLPAPAPARAPTPTPAPTPGEPTPALGLDAPPGVGGSAYGLAALPGRSGMVGGDAYRFYAALVQRELRAALNAVPTLRRRRFAVEVRLWLDTQGQVSRCELARSSGTAMVDEAVLRALDAGLGISAPPPTGLPQPIVLGIRARH